MAIVLGEIIDRSSVGGASFDLGSACFDVTRVITGQLDAYIEPGPRMVEEVNGMKAEFLRAGRGSILNNSPYDLAAAALCLREAGGIVTDARGHSLDGRPLLGSGPEHQMSCLAVANAKLHRVVLEALDDGIAALAKGWTR
jgi:myo-inositol-1(or 4)-monophosphatase